MGEARVSTKPIKLSWDYYVPHALLAFWFGVTFLGIFGVVKMGGGLIPTLIVSMTWSAYKIFNNAFHKENFIQDYGDDPKYRPATCYNCLRLTSTGEIIENPKTKKELQGIITKFGSSVQLGYFIFGKRHPKMPLYYRRLFYTKRFLFLTKMYICRDCARDEILNDPESRTLFTLDNL